MIEFFFEGVKFVVLLVLSVAVSFGIGGLAGGIVKVTTNSDPGAAVTFLIVTAMIAAGIFNVSMNWDTIRWRWDDRRIEREAAKRRAYSKD